MWCEVTRVALRTLGAELKKVKNGRTAHAECPLPLRCPQEERAARVQCALERLSYDWVATHHPGLLALLSALLARGATPEEIDRTVKGSIPDGLAAQTIYQCAQYLRRNR